MVDFSIVEKSIAISKYNDEKNTVTLSNGFSIEGSFILTDTEFVEKIKLKSDLDTFLTSPNNFSFLINYVGKKEICLIGVGDKFVPPSLEIQNYIKNLGFGLEWMITKNAYNVFNFMVEDFRSCVSLFINN